MLCIRGVSFSRLPQEPKAVIMARMEHKAKKQICLGVLAHVDAGKTTLSEAILYRAGVLSAPGRVDHGDTALDTHELERKRGITIFSAQAGFDWGGTGFTLLDTPGHVDFSGEMERTLGVIDCAVLVISGADGVQAHTETLWRLLRRYGKPVILFVTKMDLEAADRDGVLTALQSKLDEHIYDFSDGPPDGETLAMCDEALLDRYLDSGAVADADVRALIAERKLFPCWFGSGLRGEGIDEFLDGIDRYTPEPAYPESFGARVFKISHDAKLGRMTHVKLTGGSLKVRDALRYRAADGTEIEEKLTGLRVCAGAKWGAAETVSAGEVCVLLGLSGTYAGQGLGFEADALSPALSPAMTYRLGLPSNIDALAALPKLRQLEEEDPLLRFVWNARRREIEVQLMGRVQIEILKSLIFERFGWEVSVDTGHVTYRETIAAPVEGAGHYEPLRHYAEVHLLLEPLERGRGIELKSECPTDALDLNWQRLILTHLAEKPHLGVLTGSPLTDVRVTLTAGRAHLKHTEGGDFRQATYRAVRQGLMKARSLLLEPYYSFRLEVPLAQTGRAIGDIRAMHGTFETESAGDATILTGSAPVAAMRDYAAQVAAYTGGRGKFSCEVEGFRPCHNTAEVVATIGYDPEADVENSPDSVFCAHGAGFVVKWDRADEYMHLETGLGREGTKLPAAPRLRMGNLSIDDRELEAIMEREFGPIRRPMYTKPAADRQSVSAPVLREKKELVVVDGYNVIFAWEELKALAEDNLGLARQRLAEILVSYRGFTGSDIVLVFDGYAVKDNPGEKSDYHGVRVVYTKQNESADLYIQELLHGIGKNSSVRVVTSDNLIRLSALGSGILRTNAREFGTEVDWVMGQIGDILRRSAQKAHSTTLADSMVK